MFHCSMRLCAANLANYIKLIVQSYLMEAKVTLYAVGSEEHFPVASQY